MLIEMGAASHVGQVRAINEDSFLARGSLALVADGMGGHACGDVASDLTVREFGALAERPELALSDIHDALQHANDAILQGVSRDSDKAGMGTTVTGLAVVEYGGLPHWLVFNVGDSRVYRLGDHGAEQLTVDHSEVAELVAAGRISAEEAKTHPLRNVITRSLGTDPPPTPDVWIFPPRSGDVFVICSDGLTNEIDDGAIAALIALSPSAVEGATRLVDAALAAGGRDNITAIVVRLTDAVDETGTVSTATVPRKLSWTGEL
ncbi:MAG TPA: protein phosphatase 2C domain-containing protein [Marmoricola sp.]